MSKDPFAVFDRYMNRLHERMDNLWGTTTTVVTKGANKIMRGHKVQVGTLNEKKEFIKIRNAYFSSMPVVGNYIQLEFHEETGKRHVRYKVESITHFENFAKGDNWAPRFVVTKRL